MYFHIQMIHEPANAGRRADSIPAHWAYLTKNAAHLLARGPTVADDNDADSTGSVFFAEFADWRAVREFVDREPHNNNGIFRTINVNRWEHALGRSQSEFPAEKALIHWYVRACGAPGNTAISKELLEAQRGFYARHDEDKFIVRGAIYDDEGNEWQGTASLIALPTRAAVEALLAEEPFSKAGMYRDILIQRHKFGGTPPQSK